MTTTNQTLAAKTFTDLVSGFYMTADPSAMDLPALRSYESRAKKIHSETNSAYQSVVSQIKKLNGKRISLQTKLEKAKKNRAESSKKLAQAEKGSSIDQYQSDLDQAKKAESDYQTQIDQILEEKERLVAQKAALFDGRRAVLERVESASLLLRGVDETDTERCPADHADQGYALTEKDVELSAEFIASLKTVREKMNFINEFVIRGIKRLKTEKNTAGKPDFSDIKRTLLIIVSQADPTDKDDFLTTEFRRISKFIKDVSPYTVKVYKSEDTRTCHLVEDESKEWKPIPAYYWAKVEKPKDTVTDKVTDLDKEITKIKKWSIDPELTDGKKMDYLREIAQVMGVDLPSIDPDFS